MPSLSQGGDAAVAGVEFECSVNEYPSFVANLPTLQEPHYVLYTSDLDEQTKQPWCPDCKHADPIIEEVIKQTGGTLLKVKVRVAALQGIVQTVVSRLDALSVCGV